MLTTTTTRKATLGRRLLLREARPLRLSQRRRRRRTATSTSCRCDQVSGPRAWLARLLPDERSRWVSLLIFLAAIGMWWLIDTITSKWIHSIHHTAQVLTFERAASLPAMFGAGLHLSS